MERNLFSYSSHVSLSWPPLQETRRDMQTALSKWLLGGHQWGGGAGWQRERSEGPLGARFHPSRTPTMCQGWLHPHSREGGSGCHPSVFGYGLGPRGQKCRLPTGNVNGRHFRLCSKWTKQLQVTEGHPPEKAASGPQNPQHTEV